MHYCVDRAGVWVDCVRERKAVVHNDYASLPHRKGLPEGHAPVVRELVVPVIKDQKIVAILGIGNKPSDYTDEDVRTVSFLADVTWEIVGRRRRTSPQRAKPAPLFASMAEMVVLRGLVFDESGNPVDYRIIGCNDAYTRITGIKKERAVGRLATDVYGAGAPPYLEEFARVAVTGEPYHYETYFPPMDKHFAVSVVSPGKNRFATITTDISESKRIQAIIDSKNKELEQIVYVASHDLRSPLVNVDGYSRELEYSLADIETALETGSDGLEKALSAGLPEMKSSINRIRVSAAQMDKLLKGLLRLSRQGRASLQFENIDMNRCMERLIETFSYTIADLGVELTVDNLPPCSWRCRSLRFSNLIGNAIKYRIRQAAENSHQRNHRRRPGNIQRRGQRRRNRAESS